MPSKQHKSVRLFEDDRLERLTKVHPITPLLIFIPVLIWMAFEASAQKLPGLTLIAYGVSGFLLFTFVEYSIHRFLFHFKPIGPKSERLIFLFHGIHHVDPHDPMRLVMPPSVSIPLSTLMYVVFAHMLPGSVLPVFFFGFISGYLFYDMGHYAFHHLKLRNPTFRYLRKYHFLHHFQDQEHGYGVSSPLWDYVFQTQFDKSLARSQSSSTRGKVGSSGST